jgi:hypothetical protein
MITVAKTMRDYFAGICPACGTPVPADEPDGPVWTCRADLNEANPYYEPLPEDWQTSEDEKDASGYFANCPEGRLDRPETCPHQYPGGPGHMPLHSACYERGDY